MPIKSRRIHTVEFIPDIYEPYVQILYICDRAQGASIWLHKHRRKLDRLVKSTLKENPNAEPDYHVNHYSVHKFRVKKS